MSRVHARLFLDQGDWFCIDEGSSNGTVLNGQAVGSQPEQLTLRSDLRVGSHLLTIELSGASNPLCPAAPVRFGTASGLKPSDGKSCLRCGKALSWLGKIGRSNSQVHCKECVAEHQLRLAKFSRSFSALAMAALPFGKKEISHLQAVASNLELTEVEAFGNCRAIGIELMRRSAAMLTCDQQVDTLAVRAVHDLQADLLLSNEDVAPILRQIEFSLRLQDLRSGRLPLVPTHIILGSTEICHFSEQAVFERQTPKGVKKIDGLMVISNERVRFVSAGGGFEFLFSKIASVRLVGNDSVLLELTRTNGNGRYFVRNTILVCELLLYLVRHSRRLTNIAQASSRAIPQTVKHSVWNRDGGKCVQCSAQDNLEYDHIIPFSRGGASSVDNLQVLCRRCNLSKGAKI